MDPSTLARCRLIIAQVAGRRGTGPGHHHYRQQCHNTSAAP